VEELISKIKNDGIILFGFTIICILLLFGFSIFALYGGENSGLDIAGATGIPLVFVLLIAVITRPLAFFPFIPSNSIPYEDYKEYLAKISEGKKFVFKEIVGGYRDNRIEANVIFNFEGIDYRLMKVPNHDLQTLKNLSGKTFSIKATETDPKRGPLYGEKIIAIQENLD
jgi:hypothetical protein